MSLLAAAIALREAQKRYNNGSLWDDDSGFLEIRAAERVLDAEIEKALRVRAAAEAYERLYQSAQGIATRAEDLPDTPSDAFAEAELEYHENRDEVKKVAAEMREEADAWGDQDESIVLWFRGLADRLDPPREER